MSKLTAKEILAIVENAGVRVKSFAYGDYNSVELGLGEVEEVKQRGGEGEGDVWYVVQHFKDHDVYIRTDGFYSSYEGVEFYEGFGREVFPELKTITVFE